MHTVIQETLFMKLLLFTVHKTLKTSVINLGPVHDEVSVQLTIYIHTHTVS